MAKWLNPCHDEWLGIQITTSDSQVQFFFSVITGDYHMSFGVCALSNAHSRGLAALLRENEYIWENVLKLIL